MDRSPPFSRRALLQSLWGVAAVSLSGCGTLMYPERRGQGRDGGIDWTVAGMDAIGLIFFFVPGVIAFAIDYYNGTLFFPDNSHSAASLSGRTLRKVTLRTPHPTWREISSVIETRTGKRLGHLEHSCVTRRIQKIEEFWDTETLLAAAVLSPPVIRCQSQDSVRGEP